MTLEEYRKELQQSVRARAAADGDFQLSAFVAVASEILAEAGELSDFTVSHFRGTGSKKRSLWIDGYAEDEVDGSLRVLVADWSTDEADRTVTQTDAKSILGRVLAFLEDAVSGRLQESVDVAMDVAGLARLLYEGKGRFAKYRIYFATDAVLSDRVKEWPEGAVAGTPYEFNIWDVSRFYRASESGSGRDEIVIDFAAMRAAVPCLQASVNDAEYEAYLCAMPGSVIADIYNKYGSRLLEGNVRSFLSVRGKINKGIRATLLKEPGMFFAYNNGIAATASSVKVIRSGNGWLLEEATDLQIVNGGQTTASLAAARDSDKADLSAAFVPMKLSVVASDKSGEIIPRIAKYANSQNKVSEADFFSNHDFHRRLEQLSRQIWAPAVGGAQHETHWFYERARGQFVNEQAKLTKAEKLRFLAQNPRAQLVTKTDLAKVENSWRGLPHTVSLGAQKNFLSFADWISSQWEKSDAAFNVDYFKRVVARTLLFRELEARTKKLDWYQGGYRANIVTYTVARFALALRQAERELDYARIWSAQELDDALCRHLELLAEKVYAILVAPPPGIQNVTEWSKKTLCWQKVQELTAALPSRLSGCLVGVEEDRARLDVAKSEQNVTNRIHAQIDVMNLGQAYWMALAGFAIERSLAVGNDLNLLRVAARIPAVIPTDKQSLRLLELKEELEAEGFVMEGA